MVGVQEGWPVAEGDRGGSEMTYPSIVLDMPNADYHAHDSVSKSGLWTLHTKSPAHYKFAERDETDSMRLGTLTHAAVLEPEIFERDYKCAPPDAPKYPTEAQWNAKKPSEESVAAMIWWRRWEAENSGVTLVKVDEYSAAARTRDALHADPTIRSIFAAKPVIEASAFWVDELTGEVCRCRPDAAIDGLLVDLKTINDASGDGCIKAVQSWGYNAQNSWYSDGWQLAGGSTSSLPFLFVFVEPRAPFCHKILELDSEFIEMGRKIMRRSLNKYAECKRQNSWPGYPTAVQRVEPLGWYRNTFNLEFANHE